jgi:hypothetical protein
MLLSRAKSQAPPCSPHAVLQHGQFRPGDKSVGDRSRPAQNRCKEKDSLDLPPSSPSHVRRRKVFGGDSSGEAPNG